MNCVLNRYKSVQNVTIFISLLIFVNVFSASYETDTPNLCFKKKKRLYIVATNGFNRSVISKKKGYLFLRCMYVIETSKLLREDRWKKKSE